MFDFHLLNDQGKEEVKAYKKTLADAARSVAALMPESREKSLFVTNMEHAVFWGAKAVAQKEGNFESKQEF